MKYRGIVRNGVVFIVTFAILVIFFHFVRFPVVDGDSMLPTYHNGDRLVVLYTKNVSRGDVVTLWNSSLDEYIVKRVIGVQGDHIVITNGNLFVNGHCMYEPYILQHDWAATINDVDIVVGEDQLYVLGDNRNNSTDSRMLGLFTCDDIFGRVLMTI